MKKLLFTLLVFLTTVSVAYGANNLWEYYTEQGLNLPSVSERANDYYGYFGGREIYRGTAEQNVRLLEELQGELTFGAWSPVGGLTYRLQASIGKTSTSIKLSSFKNRSDILLTMTIMGSDIGYGTLSPQTTRSEFVSFTGVTQNSDGTATLTGVSRGLADITPFTASTTMANTHPGQSVFILSDSPQLFEEYASRRSNDTITGAWNFSTNLPYSALAATTSQQFVNKSYADGLAIAGISTTTESTFGGVTLGTQLEMASSTHSAADPKVLYTKYSTSSPDVRGLYVVISENDGYINQGWLDLSEAITYSGSPFTISGATTTISSATTTISDTNAVLGIGTSTPALKGSGVSISSDVYIAGGLGVGVATTSDNNLVVAGLASTTNLVVSGTQTGGTFSYTASSSGTTLSTGTFTSTIPSEANFAMGKWDIDDSIQVEQGTMVLARAGLTTMIISAQSTSATYDGGYTFTWSGDTLTVEETTDDSTDSSITFTLYWYR